MYLFIQRVAIAQSV